MKGPECRSAGPPLASSSNGGFGLYSHSRGSIKVSGLGTKPVLTWQGANFRFFSGATTSALFSETEAHPNKTGDVIESHDGSVVFLA